MSGDDEHTDVEPLITKVTKRAETAQDVEIVQRVYADESVPVKAPEPEAAPAEPPPEEEDEPAWAALFSYETYEQVAKRVLRAGTEVAREGYQRHDAAVIVIALALIVGGGILHRRMLRPQMETFEERGLSFERTAQWLAPETVLPAPVRLIPDAPAPPRPSSDELPFHVELTSALDADVRLEVQIDELPQWSNTVTVLELDRRTRFGELYALHDSSSRSIAGNDWLRSAYTYAYAAEKGDTPRIGHAVEYAIRGNKYLYAVTFHGSPAQVAYLEDVIASTLRIDSRSSDTFGKNRVAQVRAPPAVKTAMASNVMVVVADLVGGRLRAVGGGSGVIVSPDGSIATNYHVVDGTKKLHDVFVIGRQVTEGQPPQMICAGSPSRSKLQPELDLALIKCDTDLEGRPWKPVDGGAWPALTEVNDKLALGQRLWLLGYPDRGRGSMTVSQGVVEGYTGEDDSLGKDYIKTDASLTHGNSGGPVVDDQGHVVGMADAFRYHVTATGDRVESVRQGLIRPWSALGDVLAIARTGWTPREGKTSIELEPNAVEVAPEGVMISTTIVDALNLHPVAGALLYVMRADVGSSDVDMNRLDDQVLAWGRSNEDGEVHLKQPVPQPGQYTVVVVKRGYDILSSDDALQLDEETAPFFDPWGLVKIHPLQ